jgi:hypothetical protein
MLKKRYRTRNIWGFDSFQGYPEPTEKEKQVVKEVHPHYGARPKGFWSRTFEEAYVRVYETGYSRERLDWVCPCCPPNTERVNIIKGFFEETIPDKYEGSKIALLHLDCNLYGSYKHCLESLYDKVVPGGIVMFDEYRSPVQLRNCPGASVAIDEFLGDRKKRIQKVMFEDQWPKSGEISLWLGKLNSEIGHKNLVEKYFIRKIKGE